MALTAAQLQALQLGTAEGKLAVEIDVTTPLRYCSGSDAVQISGDWYTPRHCEGSYFALSHPGAARTHVIIDDRDEVLETAWYAERYSGAAVTVHILLREVGVRAWTVATSIEWSCSSAEFSNGDAKVNLYGATGHRQRYGLEIGNGSKFPHAPGPNQVFTFRGGGTMYVNDTPPWMIAPVEPEGVRVILNTKPLPIKPKKPKG